MKIEIKNRYTGKVIISGKYENIKDCLGRNRGAYLVGAYLVGADLGGAYLRGAYLRGADLEGADLGGAYLRGAKNYEHSHGFFKEIIRRQPIKTFTQKEWSIIGQIIVHTLCWDSIKKRFKNTAMPIFKKLEKVGYGEWADKYKEITR